MKTIFALSLGSIILISSSTWAQSASLQNWMARINSAPHSAKDLAQSSCIQGVKVRDGLSVTTAFANRINQRLVDGLKANGIHLPQMNCLEVMWTMQNGSEATADGLVEVSMDQFEGFQSEDQFAFVLAHELAHFLLGHHDATQNFIDALPYKGPNSDLPIAFLRREKMGDPKFVAFLEQTEEEADILGSWILTMAGYDPSAAIQALFMLNRPTDSSHQDHPSADRSEQIMPEALANLCAALKAGPRVQTPIPNEVLAEWRAHLMTELTSQDPKRVKTAFNELSNPILYRATLLLTMNAGRPLEAYKEEQSNLVANSCFLPSTSANASWADLMAEMVDALTDDRSHPAFLKCGPGSPGISFRSFAMQVMPPYLKIVGQ